MEEVKTAKKAAIEKLIKGAIGLLVLTVALTFCIFVYTFYKAYKGEYETDSLVKNQITIPLGATDLTVLGNDWYSFKMMGKTILLHKKVSYLTGDSAESMTTLDH